MKQKGGRDMTGDYEVGYKKPPKHGQFRPGESGNPKGKPSGAKNLKTELQEELAETIKIKESGHAKTVSKQRAMLKSLTAKAVQGDTKAANVVLGMIFKFLHDQPDDGETIELTQTDRAILEDFKTSILKAARTKRKKNAR